MPRTAKGGLPQPNVQALALSRRRDRERSCHRCGGRRSERRLFVPGGQPDLAMCAKCYATMLRLWASQASRAATLNRYYKKLYKLTLEDYGALFIRQKGQCAICHLEAEDKPLVVDHDHDTGEVRGLLCGTCNSAIGLLKDDPEVIVQAALYLYRAKFPELGAADSGVKDS